MYCWQLLAYVLMTLDHTVTLIENDYIQIVFIMLGRLALPLFLYGVAEGFRKTTDRKKYYYRLMLLALISEPVFYLMFERFCNVVWVLAYAFMILELSEYDKGLAIAVNCVFLAMPGYWFFAGGLILIFHYLKGLKQFLGALGLMCFWAFDPSENMILQPIAAFAIPIIHVFKGRLNIKNRLIKYAYYPTHLTVLFALKSLVQACR